MAAPFKLRDVLIGRQIIPSRAEFKRLMLTGYLSAICILVSVFYFMIDMYHQVYYSFPAYSVLFFLPLTSLWLIRLKKFRSAKVLLMVSANLAVFWTAIHDPFETGVFLFFIPTSMGSFAILAFDDYKTGLALVILTTFLFFISYFTDFHVVDIERPTDEYIRISFVINYFISAAIAVMAIFFLMSLNSASERELIRKENFANQKNAELQKVNDELDRFVYSVSHDLRSPLSSILGLTNVARMAKDKDEIDRILEMIQSRVSAQDHFIREIIDFSRNARTETVPERINLRRFADDVVNSLRYNINAEKIEFKNLIADNCVLITDRIRLTIILNNLIGNSIKYHDFTKDHPFIEIGFVRNPLAIYVSDNGIGIKPEHLDKIFEMFYRGSDRSTGSGLGLFITKEAVLKMDGRIDVSSTYGCGSKFTVYLPEQQVADEIS